MEYSRDDKIRIGQEVVRATRRTAKVKTGFLKRSIRATLQRDKLIFREIEYGAYKGNARLIENAKRIVPKEIQWEVIFVDFEGNPTQIKGETRTGRSISRSVISSLNVSTQKIKALISSINGKKENDTTEANRDDNV